MNATTETSATIKWKRTATRACVLHFTTFQGISLEVWNWVGTRTLWIAVKKGNYEIHRDFDRVEHGVGSLKDKAIEMAIALRCDLAG